MSNDRMNRPGRRNATEEDILDIKEEFFVELTPEQLKTVEELFSTTEYSGLLNNGRQWGWDDTEVREELGTLLNIEE